MSENGTVTVVKNSDFAVWLKIKQRAYPDLYLGVVYIPPLDSSSTISSFQDNNAFHLLQEEITHFSQKGTVAISGDFNARTGRLPDFTLFIDPDNHNILTSFQHNMYNFSQHNRHSDDIKFNRYGKELLELCKSSNMRIMNGYYNNDATTGTFTC